MAGYENKALFWQDQNQDNLSHIREHIFLHSTLDMQVKQLSKHFPFLKAKENLHIIVEPEDS